MKTIFFEANGMDDSPSCRVKSRPEIDRYSRKRALNLNLNLTAVIFILFCLSAAPLRAQWKQMKVGGSFVNVHAVTFAGDAVFAGADQGIYRTTIDVTGWEKVDSVSAFCVAGNGSEIFAGTSYGVIRSENSGKTWSTPDSVLGKINALLRTDAAIYAAGAGLYRSKDNGLTWTKIENGLPQNMFPVHGLAVDGTLLLAATNAGLIISSDGGNHWTEPKQPNRLPDYCVALAGTTLFAGTSEGLLSSTDGGKTWGQVTSFPDTISVYSMVANSTYLYAGTDIGVLRSPDYGGTDVKVPRSPDYGKTWTLPTWPKQVHALAVSGYRVIAASLQQDIFYSSDEGILWEPRSIGDADRSGSYLAGKGSHIFTVLDFTKLYVSHDKGNTWEPDTTLPTKKRINSVTVVDSNVYAVTDGGIFRSADWGKTWKGINGGVMGTVSPRTLVKSGNNLVVNTQNDGIFYSPDAGQTWNKAQGKMGSILALGTTGSELVSSDGTGIYRSLDNGVSWSVVNDTLPDIRSFASSGKELFAGRIPSPPPESMAGANSTLQTNILFRSTDQGKSWERFGSGLPDYLVSSLAVHYPDIFASLLVRGLYVSNVTNDNWKKISQGLPPNVIWSIYANNSYVYAGVSYGGVWRRPISQITTSTEQETTSPVPNGFQLKQNYPNPFNPTTTISYKLPVRVHVKLSVYNVLGQQVEILVNKIQAPGRHTVQLKATGLASGVYFYRLRAGNFVKTKKLVVLK